jgi:hypothetical protein
VSSSISPHVISSTTSLEKALHNNSLPRFEKDFQHIYGHQQAKHALEIAAVGAHVLVLTDIKKRILTRIIELIMLRMYNLLYNSANNDSKEHKWFIIHSNNRKSVLTTAEPKAGC